MKKALLITYAFSPHATPESFLSAKLFANIKDLITDVATIKHPIPGIIDLDPSLEKYIDKNFGKIYRCELTPFFKFISKYNLKQFFRFPDYFRIMNKFFLRYIIKNIDIKKYDYIITWSQSHSVHLLGLKLNKIYKLNNWIAYFSDPWSNNPFFNKSYFGIEKFLNIINEKKVFITCNKIICTSEATKELMSSRYNNVIKNKIYVIPHCFDKSLYSSLKDKFKNFGKKKITFRYIGKFYGERFPKIFINALKIIEKKKPDIFKKIQFEVYGSQNSLVTAKIFFNKKYIKLYDPLSYSRSLKIMQESDYLLVIDAPFSKSVFFPSKLVDYMGSNKIVIGITPKGTARDIIKKMGGYTFSHDNSYKLSNQILNLLIKNKKKNLLNKKFINTYNSKVVSKKFLKVLNI